jgi:hypothetical protein
MSTELKAGTRGGAAVPAMTAERVRMHLQCRFNPIRGLTPELLSQWLERWMGGHLREFALAAEVIEERDHALKSVAGKRKRAASRHSWEVKIKEGQEENPEAIQQKEALEYLYDNLRATHALEMDQTGGMKLLIRQMMDAVGKKYAVHELVWRPMGGGGQRSEDRGQRSEVRGQRSEGGEAREGAGAPPEAREGAGAPPKARGGAGAPTLTVECRFVPLWFFESMTGRLRFLESDTAYEGAEMEADGWMVTVGDGLMLASSICYMFKRLPLQDWLSFCGKYGLPGILGKTDAPKSSKEWDDLVEMVENWGNDLAAVISRSSEIEIVDAPKQSDAPFAPLVEYMDRAMATLWRGGDLGTMSKDNSAVGSNPQETETQILEEDDCEMIAETLQERISKPALRQLFGEGCEELAFIELMPDPKAGQMALANFKRQVWTAFQADGTVNDIMANMTDLRQLTTDVGLPVEPEYVEPWVPVTDDQGNAITGEVVKDSEGDIVGGASETPETPEKPSDAKAMDGPRDARRMTELANEASGQRSEARGQGDEGLIEAVARAASRDLAPFRERLTAILGIEDPAIMQARLRGLIAEIEQLKKDISADPEMARAVEGVIAQGLVKGMTEDRGQ